MGMIIIPTRQDIVRWGGTALTGRDISADLQTLSDDTVKGILRSLGDAGATPTGATGKTLLKLLTDILAGTVVTQSTYGSLKTASYKPADAIGDLSAILGTWANRDTKASASAGTNTMYSASVGTGQIAIITQITVLNSTHAITGCSIYALTNELKFVGAVAVGLTTEWTGHVYLPATKYISADILGCTAGDHLVMTTYGYTIDLY